MESNTNLTLHAVEQLCDEQSRDRPTVLDLDRIVHGRFSHQDVEPLAVLSWWLLGTSEPPGAIRVPVDREAARVLARAGVPFAADRRGVELLVSGQPTTGRDYVTGQAGQQQLTNVNWRVYDEGVEGDCLRAIVDLEDPRRRPPDPIPLQGNRRYPWIDGLGAGSALDAQPRTTFYGDADQVLYETISNVHTWAAATRAVAVVSATRGGGELSHNRMHVVTADNGRGIIEGVEYKRCAERWPTDWRSQIETLIDTDEAFRAKLDQGRTNPSPTPFPQVESALVLALVERAFLHRPVESTQDGHGLHASGVTGSRWGSLDVYTALPEQGCVVHVSARAHQFAVATVALPGARGTLVHARLDATQENAARLGDDPTQLALGLR